MLFEVLVDQRERWATVAVTGEMDLATAPQVRQAVIQAIAEGNRLTARGDDPGLEPGPRVLLDLSGVDFIDSSGLGVVLGAVRRVRGTGGTIRLVVTEPQVRRAFELTGLDQVLSIAATVAEAMAPPGRPRGAGDG